jgi:uncharacterized Zn finger protein (UPF0148 family)
MSDTLEINVNEKLKMGDTMGKFDNCKHQIVKKDGKLFCIKCKKRAIMKK